MEVILLNKFYGYCPGLKRSLKVADDVAKEAIKENKKIYFDVPLAHNEIVEKNLEKKGFLETDLSESSDGKDNLFLVSAHGASSDKISWLRDHNFVVRSATCPTVRRVQDIAIKDHKDGFQIVLFGKKDHAEILGVNGCIDDSAVVIKSAEEAKDLIFDTKISIICQTTFPVKEFEEVVKLIKKNNPKIDITIRKTICPIVEGRIHKVCDYARKAKIDLGVVVGSITSSNTKQLNYKLKEVVPTIMIGDETEISAKDFQNINKVLVVSGTSAPPEVVERVAEKIRSFA